jgi:hypothetical protein
LVGFHGVVWYGLLDIRNKSWRRFRAASQLLSKDIKKAGRLGRIRIVETPSVKVPWESSSGHMCPG